MTSPTPSARSVSSSAGDSVHTTCGSIAGGVVDNSFSDPSSHSPTTSIPSTQHYSRGNEMSERAEVVDSPSPIDIVVEVIKKYTDEEYVLDGVTYYGVSQEQLMCLRTDGKGQSSPRQQARNLASILRGVANAFKQENHIQVALEQFDVAIKYSGGLTCYSRSRVFVSHGKRFMTRLIAAYQDYYKHHPSQLSTLLLAGKPGGGGAQAPPSIVNVYETQYDIDNPVGTLESQFLQLSTAWRELVEESTGQGLWQAERSTAGPRSLGGTVESKMTRSSPRVKSTTSAFSLTSTTGRSSSHQSHSAQSRLTLMAKPSYGAAHDLANREHLQNLAKMCLVADWSAEPPVDFSGNLEDMSRNLPDCHQYYLNKKLLPYFTWKNILQVVVLAVILGFSEVTSRIPKGKKIKDPTPPLIRRLRGIGFRLSESEPRHPSPDEFRDLWDKDLEIGS